MNEEFIKLDKEFLEKHQNASNIVYNKHTKELVCAIYSAPSYQAKCDIKNFFTKVCELLAQEHWTDGGIKNDQPIRK